MVTVILYTYGIRANNGRKCRQPCTYNMVYYPKKQQFVSIRKSFANIVYFPEVEFDKDRISQFHFKIQKKKSLNLRRNNEIKLC